MKSVLWVIWTYLICGPAADFHVEFHAFVFVAESMTVCWYVVNYTVFRKKHPLTVSFISP